MKTILLLTLLLTMGILPSPAQTKTEAKPKKTGNEWHAAGDALSRSQTFSGTMTKALGLDQETAKSVQRLSVEHQASR